MNRLSAPKRPSNPAATSRRRKTTLLQRKKRKHATIFKPTTVKRDPGLISSLTAAGGEGGNQLFAAGVGLSMLGVGLSMARKAALQGVVQLERHFTTSLEIQSKDRSYHWVLNWCTAQTKGKSQHVGVETRVVHQGNGVHATSFDFVPSPGRHYIWYKRHLVQIVREREKMSDITTGSPFETVKLTLFSRNRAIFQDILQEAEQAALQKEEGRVTIYMPMMTDWRPFGRPRPKRPIDSVILDDGIAEFLQTDLKDFQRGGKWYKDKGIPHRRGYLLYGPPGSGKTSFIQALAGEMGYSICVLSLNDRGLSDDRLLHLMTDLPPRSMLLLEDIDAVFNQRESTYSVTFSGLLNALDGVTSVDERIVFMTTNHLEKLDPALIRPGRVDAKVYIGDSTGFQQKKMFKAFFPDVTDCPFDLPADPIEHPSPTAKLTSDILDGTTAVPPSMNETTPTTKPTKKKLTEEEEQEEYRKHLEADAKPLHEFMSTDNTEAFGAGLANRAKEQVEIPETDIAGVYNNDGTTQRLSIDTIMKRVNPDFFSAVEQDLPLTAGLLRPVKRDKFGQVIGGVITDDGDKEEIEAQRKSGLSDIMLDMERQLGQEENPVAVELRRREAFKAVINKKRAAKGLPPLTVIKELPAEFVPKDETPEEIKKRQDAFNKKAHRQAMARRGVELSRATRWEPLDNGASKNNAISLTEPHTRSETGQVKVDYRAQSRQYQNKALFAVTETERLANEFVRTLSEAPISMAELQSLMLLYKDRPRMCIQGAKQLVKEKQERLAKKQAVEDAARAPKAAAADKANPTMSEQMYQNDKQKAQITQEHIISQFKK